MNQNKICLKLKHRFALPFFRLPLMRSHYVHFMKNAQKCRKHDMLVCCYISVASLPFIMYQEALCFPCMTLQKFSQYDIIVIADRSSNPFCLLNPDVRRMHTNVADDNVLLVSTKSDEPPQQRRFELKTPPPKLSLLSSKRPAQSSSVTVK